ncbi:MAG: hypothetical protein O3B13_00670 [Planctomycetota bacterium]|nr:hypothetical protein [Planctomycetota bacterium]
MTDQSPLPAPADVNVLVRETVPASETELSPAIDNSPNIRRRWSRSVRATIGLILYVFSIGPMFWYWYEAENMGGSPLVRVVYAPLRLLCAIPQVQDWLNHYINWWIA